jgi:cold shock CspA family protein
MRGTVKSFSPISRYGFVVTKECDEDLFFHERDLRMKVPIVSPGAPVTFEVERARDGRLRAKNLKAVVL